MVRWLGCCVALGLLVCSALSAAAADQPAAKVLLIGKSPDHPHGSHMYLHTCGVLGRCLELTPGVTAVVSNGWPQDAAVLEGISTIVVYTSPGAELLLDGPHRDAVDQQIKRGVGLVTLHWASSVYQKDLERLGPTWLSYLGGTWVSNVGLGFGRSPLKQLVPEHPVCRGWQSYEIEDEFYLNPTLERATPLLEVTERTGKQVVVGWTFERPDGGRSFATTLGHPYRNFQQEPFRRMVVNAILWTAKVEVPATGAAVDIGEEALALPPKP